MAGQAMKFLMPPIQDKGLEFTKYFNFLISLLERKRNALNVLSRPFDLSINPTIACQLHCPQCRTGTGDFDRPITNLTTDKFSQMGVGLYDKVFIARFFGTGESLLNKNFTRLVEQISEFEIYSFFTTNLSVKMSDRQIDDLLLCGIRLIGVSLDGVTAESYSRYRVGGDFDLVVNNMRRLVKRKKELGLSTPLIQWRFLVFEHNKHEVAVARELAGEYEVDLLEFYKGAAPKNNPGGVQRVDPAFDISPIYSGPAFHEAIDKKHTPFHQLLKRRKTISPPPPAACKNMGEV